MTALYESDVEKFAVELLEKQGYAYIPPEQQETERDGVADVVLRNRLKTAIDNLNPKVPDGVRQQAIRQVLSLSGHNLIASNQEFYRMLVEGVAEEYQKDGETVGARVRLIDFKNPHNNNLAVCNQFTVTENNTTKRPDVVVFINGLPVAVIELKNPTDEQATVRKAFDQLQNYKETIPSLFCYNGVLVASDGLDARAGSLTAGWNRFMAWKTVDGEREDPATTPWLETVIRGMLRPNVLIDLIRHFTVFEKSTELIPAESTPLIPSPGLSQRERRGIGNGGESEEGHYRAGMRFAGMIERVKELREKQTETEEIFWELLRNKRFNGLKFRRQHQIGHYIADFYCHSEKLIIELDGEVHNTETQKDAKRDKALKSLGNTVLRFKNKDLLNNIQEVLQKIENTLPQKSFSPSGRDGREGGSMTKVITIKKIAAYHQYHAVKKAVESTIRASYGKKTVAAVDAKDEPGKYGLPGVKDQPQGDRKAGVVWHTQGSGKSLAMVFYAGMLVVNREMENPTIVVITDRNDLDDQLFGAFAAGRNLLRQEPKQAESREHLKRLLKTAGGGIVFSTIQKFSPEEGNENFELLSDRKNIVVIADEAHRSQYGFGAKTHFVKDGVRTKYGFAKYLRDALPESSFIGFTGTPIEKEDISTPAVFGNYIDVYDIEQAVTDKATVAIYYESRLVEVHLKQEEKETLDAEIEQITESEEATATEKAKAKWTKQEAIIGHKDRIKTVVADIVRHVETRREAFEGKAMIVATSRRIAVEMYAEITALRPQWHDDDKDKGAIKVVMTSSSSDPAGWHKHATTKSERKALGERFKDPTDSLQLVIVRDMWLTGFDAPCLGAIYVDKIMSGHNLMQAIARVNRVYKDKPGGLVVDYIGIASDLKRALGAYTKNGGGGTPAFEQETAVKKMLEKYDVVAAMFGRFDYRQYFRADAKAGEKMRLILEAEEYILGLEDGKERFTREVVLLSKAFALSVPDPRAMGIKAEVGFFQAVKARLTKFERDGSGVSGAEMESAIRQIVDRAVVVDGVIDIFDAAGIKKPDISILSDDFLEEIRGMQRKNLALELLKKILADEIQTRTRKNLAQSRRFSEMLEDAIRRYKNNLLTAAQVIEELILMAKEIRTSDERAVDMGLSEDEVAFYDALAMNASAKEVMQDDALRKLAQILAESVKQNTSIDWTIKESARAKLRTVVKRLLKKYGYPPDEQKLAADRVLEQAELMADAWAAA